MGMMIVSAAAAWMTLATPADGHSVAPLPTATTKSEVTCDGPLAGAYLAPADTGLGVRAPLVSAAVTCKVINGGKSEDVSVIFTDSDSAVGLAADHPIVLGVDKEATIVTRGQINRADGSAGPATVGAGTITAALPTIRMPQNLVVLGSDGSGNADFTIVPLLGKAKVSLKVKKDSKLEVVVAGHRTGGFKSDKKGKVEVAVPSPPGFTDGSLEIADKKGNVATSEINLPAAKPLFALAVLGPPDSVLPGSAFTILAAGANPAGLPAQPSDFGATASPGTTLSTPIAIKPGLWRIDGVAASADGKVTLTLGQATRVIDVKVGAAPVAAVAPVPAPTPPAAVAGTLPPEAKPAELKPPENPAPAPTPPPAATKPAATAAVATKAPAATGDDDGTLRLALAIEAGYMTNTGAISSVAPGAMVQVAYRMGQLDLGGGIDLLVTSNSNSSTLSVNSVQIDSTTTTQSLQAMVGPYARYRFTDLIGVMGQAGLGISRVTQSITANNQVNSSGASTSPGFGALLALNLDFGLAQVFVGARYAYATASNGLSGQAGGIAGLAGIGVNLGF